MLSVKAISTIGAILLINCRPVIPLVSDLRWDVAELDTQGGGYVLPLTW